MKRRRDVLKPKDVFNLTAAGCGEFKAASGCGTALPWRSHLGLRAACCRFPVAACLPRHSFSDDGLQGGSPSQQRLRARLNSFEKERDECQSHEGQGRFKFLLAVFPEAAALLNPRDAALNLPPFRNDREFMELASFRHYHFRVEGLANEVLKRVLWPSDKKRHPQNRIETVRKHQFSRP